MGNYLFKVSEQVIREIEFKGPFHLHCADVYKQTKVYIYLLSTFQGAYFTLVPHIPLSVPLSSLLKTVAISLTTYSSWVQNTLLGT